MNDEEKFDNLLHRFEKMLQTNTNYFFDLEEFLDIIDEYIGLGNYNMAFKAIEIGLKQYPDSVDILLYKAEAYSFLDRFDKSKEILELLKELDPERLEIPLLEAELYSRKEKHHLAIRALERALKIADDKSEVYELITIEYLYLDQFKQALEAAHKTLLYNPLSATALYNAVTCYDLLDRPGDAILFLKDHVDDHPFSEVGWSLLAKKYIATEQYSQAIEALDYAIAIDDRFLGAYYDKAYAYAKLQQFDKALEFYKLTLAISDPTAFTYYYIAKIYEAKQDFDKAEQNYLLALNEDPGHYKSWYKLVKIKMNHKEYEAALSWIQKALEVVKNQDLYELLGQVHLALKNIPQAIDAFEMSIKSGALNLPIVLQLADLYKQTQQIDKYRHILLEAKKLYPDSKEIQKRMLGK